MADAPAVADLVAALESEDRIYWADAAHGPAFVRLKVQEDPVVAELIALGDQSAPLVQAKFRASTASTESALCAAAYILEMVGLVPALPSLIEYVENNLIELPGSWAAHLATHTIKVMTRQRGRNDLYYSYSSQERRVAIRRAKRRLGRRRV